MIININIIYYIQKGDVVIHCPEFSFFSVNPLPHVYTSEIEMIKEIFEKSLFKRIKRFDTLNQFLNNLIEHNVWNQNLTPHSFQHYIETLPYLTKAIEEKGSQRLLIEYSLPTG